MKERGNHVQKSEESIKPNQERQGTLLNSFTSKPSYIGMLVTAGISLSHITEARFQVTKMSSFWNGQMTALCPPEDPEITFPKK